MASGPGDGPHEPRGPRGPRELGLAAARLERECRVFARYLAGVEATPYLVEHYVAFHERCGADPSGLLDRALLAVARLGPGATAVADAYASQLCGRAALRRKLVATLALLESSAPAFERLDAPYRGGAVRVYSKLMARAGVEVGALLLGVLLFGPLGLVSSPQRGG